MVLQSGFPPCFLKNFLQNLEDLMWAVVVAHCWNLILWKILCCDVSVPIRNGWDVKLHVFFLYCTLFCLCILFTISGCRSYFQHGRYMSTPLAILHRFPVQSNRRWVHIGKLLAGFHLAFCLCCTHTGVPVPGGISM